VRLIGLVGAIALSACATSPKSAPTPDDPVETLDISAIFSDEPSRTILFGVAESGILARVIAAPNVVLSASRSTIPEGQVVGPADTETTTPTAIGDIVDPTLSGALLDYLSIRGTTLIAPAIIRRWVACDSCTSSWVERILGLARKRDGKLLDSIAENDLPTAILAIETLEIEERTITLVLEQADQGYRIRRQATRHDVGLCADLKITLPVVLLRGEVLSVRDGRLVSRLDEAIAARHKGNNTIRHNVIAPQPQLRTLPVDYLRLRFDEVSYVKRYYEEIDCARVINLVRAIELSAHQDFDPEIVTKAAIDRAIRPLYK